MANYSSSNRMALYLYGATIDYIMVVFIQDTHLYDGGICDIIPQIWYVLHIISLVFAEAIQRKFNVNILLSGLCNGGYIVHVIHSHAKANA